MAKQLNLDEMLECLIAMGHPTVRSYQTILENLGSSMALVISGGLNVECGEATFQGTGFAGTCAPFYASTESQACPTPLDLYDPEEWTTRDGEEAEMAELRGSILGSV